MEYADLAVEERLALLQGLLEQALDCEVVREVITSKVEAMALPRQKKPVRCSPPCSATLPSTQMQPILNNTVLVSVTCWYIPAVALSSIKHASN